VDSVVNSGKSIAEFLNRLAALQADVDRIVVVAGVVQARAVSTDGVLGRAPGAG
jgi:orotate phosphoribosyltransferase